MASDDKKNYPEETREEKRARRARERAKKKKILLIISLIVLVLAVLIIGLLVILLKSRIDAEKNAVVSAEVENFEMSYAGERTVFDDSSVITENTDENNSAVSSVIPTIDLSNVYSTSGIMERLSDGAVVFDQNSTEKIYPASMTKILTTIVALENIDDLDDTYTFDGSEFDRAYMQDATIAGFSAGEEVKLRDILYGIMLPSGADACYGIATAVAGSEEAFVALMNEKAQELGMNDSHFANCTGLHDEELYSTCADIMKLLKYSLQNETFYSIFTSHVYTTDPTSLHENGLTMSSSTFTYISKAILDNGAEVKGGKTGFTDEAGHCLASLAKAEDGTEYVMVTAGAHAEDDEDPHLTDAVTIYSQLPGTGQIDTSDRIYSGDDLDFGEQQVEGETETSVESQQQAQYSYYNTTGTDTSDDSYYSDGTYSDGTYGDGTYGDDTYYGDSTYNDGTYGDGTYSDTAYYGDASY